MLIAISKSRRPRRNSVRYPVNAGLNARAGRVDLRAKIAEIGDEVVAVRSALWQRNIPCSDRLSWERIEPAHSGDRYAFWKCRRIGHRLAPIIAGCSYYHNARIESAINRRLGEVVGRSSAQTHVYHRATIGRGSINGFGDVEVAGPSTNIGKNASSG
jgi:hypothetical protein